MYMSSYADKRYLLSYGICPGYGLAAAAEQEGARKSTKDWFAPNEKGSRPLDLCLSLVGDTPNSGTFASQRRRIAMGMQRAIAGSFLALGLGLAVFGTVEPAYACSCAVAPLAASPPASDVVFVGRAAQMSPFRPGSLSTDLVAVGFVTREGSDGVTVDFQQVLTPASTAACGYGFTIGKTYRVDAHRDAKGYLVTDACSSTQLTTQRVPVVMYPSDPDMRHQQLHLEWAIPLIVPLAVITVATASGLLVARRLLRR